MEFTLYKNYKGKDSPSIKRKIFNEMPDVPGFEKVFKPYGEQGAGFYYMGEVRCIVKEGHFTITEDGARKMLNEFEIILFGN